MGVRVEKARGGLRHRFRAMGSPCELYLYGETEAEAREGIAAAVAEVERLERKYSRYRDDSVTAAINARAGDPDGVEVDDETAGLLDYAAIAHVQSDGLFDPTSGVLRHAWDFRSGRLPDPADLERWLRLVGWKRLRWERPRLVLPIEGMQLDFGGFVKEYAVDRVTALCREGGARHGLVNLGGDVGVIGPHPDGAPWHVGLRDPRRPGCALGALPLSHGALASSGDYERCMVVDGRRYGHVLDPRTGWPVEGLSAVSVVADQCLVAGSATTIAMLKGREGRAWLSGLGLPCLWVDADGAVGGTLARRAPALRSSRSSLAG